MEASPKLQKAGRRFLMRLMAENGLEAAAAILRALADELDALARAYGADDPLAILSSQNGRAELGASMALGLSRTEMLRLALAARTAEAGLPAPRIAPDGRGDAAPRGLPRPPPCSEITYFAKSIPTVVTSPMGLPLLID